MSNTIKNLIFIFELVILIVVCNSINENLDGLDSTRSEAYNGNVKPVENLFKNMRNDMLDITLDEIIYTLVMIKNTIVEKTTYYYHKFLG